MSIEIINKIIATSDSKQLLEWNRKYMLHLAPPKSIIVKDGDGCIFTDIDGKKYIDFRSQSTSCPLGFRNKKVNDAIKEQLDKISAGLPDFLNEPLLKLARIMAEIAPKGLTRSVVYTSGAFANETAFKIAKRCTGRPKIISLWAAFHGMTAAALSASGATSFKMAYDPNLPGFIHIPPYYCYRCDFGLQYPDCKLACAELLAHAISYEDPLTVAAFISEPVIAGGGVVFPPDEYFRRIRKICDDHDVLLIIDEVAAGFGRTGKMFCIEHYGVSPDIMTVAKGLTSTYVPAGAVMTTEKVAERLGVAPQPTPDYLKGGVTGLTNRNHPLICAAALATLKVILEDNLVENSAKMGEYLLKAFKDMVGKYSFLGEVRGKGLLLAAEIVKDKKTKEPWLEKARELTNKMFEKGLYVELATHRLRNSAIIKMAPPLILTRDIADRSLEIFEDALKEGSK